MEGTHIPRRAIAIFSPETWLPTFLQNSFLQNRLCIRRARTERGRGTWLSTTLVCTIESRWRCDGLLVGCLHLVRRTPVRSRPVSCRCIFIWKLVSQFEVQVCLQRNNYQETRCQEVVQRLVNCCALWKDQSWKVCQGIDYPGKKEKTDKPWDVETGFSASAAPAALPAWSHRQAVAPWADKGRLERWAAEEKTGGVDEERPAQEEGDRGGGERGSGGQWEGRGWQVHHCRQPCSGPRILTCKTKGDPL